MLLSRVNGNVERIDGWRVANDPGQFICAAPVAVHVPASLCGQHRTVSPGQRVATDSQLPRPLRTTTLFRRRMLQSLGVGIAFVLFQTQGLACLLSQKKAAQETGLGDGAFAFALMHGVHLIVALLFVVFVFLQGLAGRYDHEYSWGVTFCAWFWHALGIVWLAIVAGFVIAAFAPI